MTLGPPAERGGRTAAALIGAVVGAVVAALVAGIIVAGVDRDSEPLEVTAPAPGAPGTGGLDIQGLLAASEPSVVSIETDAGSGSGFIISTDGLVLTNDHVITGAQAIRVTLVDGSTADAELVGSFPDEDVAMVRVTDRDDLVPARLGSSDALRVGDEVVAIGNALGLGVEPSVTLGIVSAKERAIDTEEGLLEHLIQTDAAINPGNSGGPLINARGEVVGINTANIPAAQNIGFAIAIDAAKPLIEELKAGRGAINPDTAFLGISSLAVDDPSVEPALLEEYGVTRSSGALVLEITADSGAARAGIQVGDVIVEADGREIRTSDDVSELVRSFTAGDELSLVIERRGEPIELTVTLGRRGG